MDAIWAGRITAYQRKWRNVVGRYKVEYVTLSGGRSIPAHLLECPECKIVDLGVELDTSKEPFTAWCSKGHEFTVDARPNA
jgi:hypothetical protein